MAKYKAVFHVDEMEKWGLLLTNATNILVAAGEGEIELSVVRGFS